MDTYTKVLLIFIALLFIGFVSGIVTTVAIIDTTKESKEVSCVPLVDLKSTSGVYLKCQ